LKILAVDFGDSRTGLAVSDPDEFLATPIGIIQEKNMAKVVAQVICTAEENRAAQIVVGLPRNMDGSEGFRAEKCRTVARLIAGGTRLPVSLWDERSTTVTAADILSQNNVYGKKRKKVLDAVAAQVILESFLAWRKNHRDTPVATVEPLVISPVTQEPE